eukprot:365259-Chlamydomonas_euryale.AAC.7
MPDPPGQNQLPSWLPGVEVGWSGVYGYGRPKSWLHDHAASNAIIELDLCCWDRLSPKLENHKECACEFTTLTAQHLPAGWIIARDCSAFPGLPLDRMVVRHTQVGPLPVTLTLTSTRMATHPAMRRASN